MKPGRKAAQDRSDSVQVAVKCLRQRRLGDDDTSSSRRSSVLFCSLLPNPDAGPRQLWCRHQASVVCLTFLTVDGGVWWALCHRQSEPRYSPRAYREHWVPTTKVQVRRLMYLSAQDCPCRYI